MANTNAGYRFSNSIDYLGDLPGGRREQDVLATKVTDSIALEVADDINRLLGEMKPYSGSVWSVQEDTPLDVSAATVDVNAPSPLDVSAAEVDVDVATNTAGVLTAGDQPLDVSGATVDVNAQNPLDVSETESVSHPNQTTASHDLIGTGDLTVGPVSVERAGGVLISANSTDSNSWSASVEWTDGSGNTIQSESASDIALSSVTQDWSRLVRKGSHITVTVTDTSGGSSNNVNVFVGAEK